MCFDDDDDDAMWSKSFETFDDDDTKKERRPEEKEKNKFESAAFPECRIRAIRVDTQKELEEEKRHLRPSLSLVRPVLTFAQYDTNENYTTSKKRHSFRVLFLELKALV